MKVARVFRVAAVAGVASMASIALAGRPLAIDDADPVDPGQFEFEAGAAWSAGVGQERADPVAPRWLAGKGQLDLRSRRV